MAGFVPDHGFVNQVPESRINIQKAEKDYALSAKSLETNRTHAATA